jgi:hypothetical protein
MNPADLRLFHHPEERLRLTIRDNQSYLAVKPVWVAPLSRPDTYLALLDGKDQEIVLLPNPTELAQDSLAAVKRELRRRYLTATVQAVHSAREEYGATYWSVETDRGARDFVTQNLQENALWFSERHLLLLDVDGNRFEILDIEALDPRSRSLVHGIV